MSSSLLFAQKRVKEKYDFDFDEVSWSEAIHTLSKECNLNFIYSDDNLPVVNRFTFQKKNATLEEVLTALFDGKFLGYRMDGDDVIVSVIRIPLDSKEGRRLTRYPVNGIIRDQYSQETVIGATVFFEDISIGTVSNFNGFYSISVPAGKYLVSIKSLGYVNLDTIIDVKGETEMHLNLKVKETKLREIVVLSSNSEVYDGILQLSNITTVTPEATNELPLILGEGDVMKSLQLMPGFKSANEGSSEISVRGGGTDQNLFLIDNVPIYNATHSLGFYSIFNTNSLKNVQTYKSGIPAQYGGRGSSVIDVHLKEGNNQKLRFSGGIGTMSANATLEVPIIKDKSSFIISGRRPYTDLLSSSTRGEINTVLFYDLSSKLKFQLDKKNTLSVSAYFSRDKLAFQNISSSEWGNKTANVTWSSLLSPKTFSNLTFWYTNYDVANIVNNIPETSYRTTYALDDYGLKYKVEQYFTPDITLKAGIESILHTYNQGSITPFDEESIVTPNDPQDIRAVESGAYMDFEWNMNQKVKVGLGLRYSRFDNVRNEREYIYDIEPFLLQADSISDGNIIDTVRNSGISFDHSYHNIDPRFSVSVALTPQQSVRVAYDRMTQYAQELALTTLPSNSGVWIPSNKYIKPLINNQYSIGYLTKSRDNMYDFSLDAYYKTSDNILEFKPNGRYIVTDHVETDVTTGIGQSYGVESIFRKRKGKLTGSVSYTYSFSFIKIPQINNGNWYPTNQDQRHVFNILASFQISKQIQFSAVWNYASGRPYTAPIGKYYKEGYVVPIYGDRNKARLPSTHHLDISLTFYRKMNEQKKNESSFNFSIYNVYARKNTYSYIFRSKNNNPQELETVKVYLFSIIPSFSYNFKF
ncbi:TonB-dependent receptor [Flammeovirga sp. EKP202]|uniref:TonB-dependent receptor n=1 Tax=Flammeovirga sp. EKP202 TaxID=2770592 RepID=UPI00165FA01D|nr:TonB-dependent receptor [Flammeovirga sp. EKP202]MBD0402751.1 TonB-dependent receptor [Flammeovirga sp. EKP202]